MVGGDQIITLVTRDGIGEPGPQLGKKLPGTAAVKPVQLFASHKKDAAQHQIGRPLGMGDCVNQRQRRTPAAAEHHPAIDAQRLADHLDIGDQMPCRVLDHTRMRPRPPAPALVEQDHAIHCRIEIAPHRRAASAPRTAMQHHHGYSLRIATLFDINAVPVTHVDHPLIERVDRRVQKFDCALLA